MGRKSLADHFFERYRVEEPGGLFWIVLYNFENMKLSKRFYHNLTKAIALTKEEVLLQHSRVITRDQRIAKTVRDLVLHYGGKVTLFKGEQFD